MANSGEREGITQFSGFSRLLPEVCETFLYYRTPQFNLLKKGHPFVWTEETQTAFHLLKQGLISAPVLQLPDFSKPFVIDTDACDYGVGAVLQQGGT